MQISIIVACANENVIGKNNKLLWYLPNDLKHFKELTTGHCILMGRKTYQSIGKALPNRTNMIVSKNLNFVAQDCIVFSDIKEAIQKAIELCEKELFIIGGEQIYKYCLPFVDKIYVTKIDHNFEGDAYFDYTINEIEWNIVSKNSFLPDEKNKYTYDFIEYVRVLSQKDNSESGSKV